MKYIRTKDGIWLNKNPNGKKEVYTARYKPTDIIKESDRIEELCDEFVHIRKNEKPVHHRRSKWLNKDHNTLKWEVKNNFCVVYGAIWTNKGLIYVAKMNEEGELELL